VPAPLETFSASGNEPGWTLSITGAMIRLSLDYGTRELEAALPSPQREDGATRYVLDDPGISVTIRDAICHDDMTGMPHPAQVVLETEEQRLRGCGGDPRDLLEGGEWTVTAVDDQPVPKAVNVTMEFLDDDRIAGSSGCNRFMGGYTLTGEGLSFGALAGTMMACPEQQMEIEQRVLAVLREVIRFEVPEPGTLVLKTHADDQLTARRSDQ
jgi:heat shock protein HslJ